MFIPTPPTENIKPMRRIVRGAWRLIRGTEPNYKSDLNTPGQAKDVNALFTPEYLKRELVDSGIQGTENEATARELQALMMVFALKPLEATPELLARLAALRGRDPAEFAREYEAFKKLHDKADAASIAKDGHPIAELARRHSAFMGSIEQLRCGALIGKALGVDPVFGAMLNPTGGLVGPDNSAKDCDSTALGYHGITHDAAGYLYNFQGQIGPGYDYLGRERGLGVETSSPLVGHREGIFFWRNTVGTDPESEAAQGLANLSYGVQLGQGAWTVGERAAGVAGHGIHAAGHVVESTARAGGSAAGGAVHGAFDALRGAAQSSYAAVSGAAHATLDAGRGAAHAAVDAAAGAARATADVAGAVGQAQSSLAAGLATGHVRDGVADARDHLAQGARDSISHVSEGLDKGRSDLAQGAADAGRHLEQSARDASQHAAQGLRDGAQHVEQGAREAASEIRHGVAEAKEPATQAVKGAAQLGSDVAQTQSQQAKSVGRRLADWLPW